MRTIEHTTQFKRDYKRERHSGQHRDLGERLNEIFETLALDKPLAERFRDHELTGNWVDHLQLLLVRELDTAPRPCP